MKKKQKSDFIGQENGGTVDSPELSDEMMKRMHPTSEVVPERVKTYHRLLPTGGTGMVNAHQRSFERLAPEISDCANCG
jgi:hypothetical protein